MQLVFLETSQYYSKENKTNYVKKKGKLPYSDFFHVISFCYVICHVKSFCYVIYHVSLFVMLYVKLSHFVMLNVM